MESNYILTTMKHTNNPMFGKFTYAYPRDNNVLRNKIERLPVIINILFENRCTRLIGTYVGMYTYASTGKDLSHVTTGCARHLLNQHSTFIAMLQILDGLFSITITISKSYYLHASLNFKLYLSLYQSY